MGNAPNTPVSDLCQIVQSASPTGNTEYHTYPPNRNDEREVFNQDDLSLIDLFHAYTLRQFVEFSPTLSSMYGNVPNTILLRWISLADTLIPSSPFSVRMLLASHFAHCFNEDADWRQFQLPYGTDSVLTLLSAFKSTYHRLYSNADMEFLQRSLWGRLYLEVMEQYNSTVYRTTDLKGESIPSWYQSFRTTDKVA